MNSDRSASEVSKSYPSPSVVACVGDSITEGYGLDDPDTESWPSVLKELIGDDCKVYNFGLSGRTLMSGTNAPYTSETYYYTSRGIKADLYFIMLGTNDSAQWDADKYRDELKSFVESYQEASPDARIILMQPPKCFSSSYGANDSIVGGELHEIIADISAELGTELIDLYSFTQDHEEWFPDGIHPNADGAGQIGKYIYDFISK